MHWLILFAVKATKVYKQTREGIAQWQSNRHTIEESLVQNSSGHCVVSLSNTLYPKLCLVLVQCRKTGNRPVMAEKILTGTTQTSNNTMFNLERGIV